MQPECQGLNQSYGAYKALRMIISCKGYLLNSMLEQLVHISLSQGYLQGVTAFRSFFGLELSSSYNFIWLNITWRD